MSAHYRIPIAPRLRPLAAQIAQEYRDGASMATLAYNYQTHAMMIGAILLHEGVERRPCGGSHAAQPRRPYRPSRLEQQHDGDRAIFAKPVRRVLCRCGVMVNGKPKPCVCSEDGVCEQCVAEHQVSASPRSGWGAEQHPAAAWRTAGGAA